MRVLFHVRSKPRTGCSAHSNLAQQPRGCIVQHTPLEYIESRHSDTIWNSTFYLIRNAAHTAAAEPHTDGLVDTAGIPGSDAGAGVVSHAVSAVAVHQSLDGGKRGRHLPRRRTIIVSCAPAVHSGHPHSPPRIVPRLSLCRPALRECCEIRRLQVRRTLDNRGGHAEHRPAPPHPACTRWCAPAWARPVLSIIGEPQRTCNGRSMMHSTPWRARPQRPHQGSFPLRNFSRKPCCRLEHAFCWGMRALPV